MNRLHSYFSEGLASYGLSELVGVEVETQYLDMRSKKPITLETSQNIFQALVDKRDWIAVEQKGDLITEIHTLTGYRILYELGRHNLELSSPPLPPGQIKGYNYYKDNLLSRLHELHKAAESCSAQPYFYPVLAARENLLVIPDARDAAWLTLDGPEPLNLLACSSAVQFTIDVPLSHAVQYLNALGRRIGEFLSRYPQDVIWKRYIAESPAGYDPLRYGGPLLFESLEQYCEELERHKVVIGTELVPHNEVSDLNIPLFLRSVWWYFRLKRYGDRLCIEVRPLPRKRDLDILSQLDWVLGILKSINVSE